jgi:preprotein translocase subunit YajC
MDSTIHFLVAQAQQNGAPAGGGIDPLGGMFIPMLIILGLMYFILMRPAQKQEKERKLKVYAIKRGDEVVFSGGILGTVVAIKEKTSGAPADGDEITVRTDGSNKLRVLRSSIYQVTPASVEAEAMEKSA